MELRQKKYEGIKVGKFGITVKRKFEMEAKKKAKSRQKVVDSKRKVVEPRRKVVEPRQKVVEGN